MQSISKPILPRAGLKATQSDPKLEAIRPKPIAILANPLESQAKATKKAVLMHTKAKPMHKKLVET